ncbi:hypothetical protein B0H19DRAFT_71327 [Mycena capillaripes]|nr:hypothetical protein B0H19DRAFT_71327 [Mycena capillaripes]
MFDPEKFKFSPMFAEFFSQDLGIQEWVTSPAPKSFPPHLIGLGDKLAVETPRNDAIRHGLSGFGRRNSFLVIYVAAVVQTNRLLLSSLGLKLHFSIYEMQKETEEGSGYGFQTNCDGALNTGIPGQVAIPEVKLGVPSAEIAELTNLAKCITDALEKEISKHEADLKEENVAALKLFVDAIHGVEISAAAAFTTRGAVGRIQQPKIEKALKYIQDHMADVITIERHFGYEVVGLDVSKPQKPRLKVKDIATDSTSTTDPFDFVHLANGTPATLPPGVTAGTTVSSATPNQKVVKEFLKNNNLLEENDQIKSKTLIGIAGLSLAAYDYVPLILRYTSLITPTDKGYTINEEKAKDYQGLLTFISHSGVPAPPRHIDAKHFESPNPILKSEEVHALLLQKQFDWLSFWTVFLDANVARSLGKLPRDLHYRQNMDAKARMVDYVHQTDAYLKGELTEVGLQRTGYWLVFGGQGFVSDPASAEAKLVEKAPLTRKDRAGFLMRRGSLAEVTSDAYLKAHSNKPFFDIYTTTMHNCIAASPPAIHQLVARMFELGVARHEAGDYASVLPTILHDVLFAPNLSDRNSDEVLKVMKEEKLVKEIVPGQPEYAKGRFLRTRNDTALVHAIDVGLGGQGTRVLRPTNNDQSIIGMRWPDTSFLDAALDNAASLAPMTVLLSAIAQKGFEKSAEKLLEYYKAGLPTEANFKKEVDQFSSVWKEMHEKHAFLVLCDAVSGNADDYLEYTDKVFVDTSRKQLVDGWAGAKEHASALKRYTEALAAIPKFDPPSRDDYFQRFVDLSPSEIERCWNAHFPKV